MPPKEREVEERFNLAALDPQSLMNARDRITQDIENFAQSLNFFNRSARIYQSAGTAIHELSESKEGQQLLLPLTQSLYVSGSLASVDQVLVDIGTGYFVEMTAEQGMDFAKRKMTKLQETMQGIQEVLRQKQNQLVQVNQVLQSKMASAEAAAAQQRTTAA